MILQALNAYYERKCDDEDPKNRLPSFGLEDKEIPFVVEINEQGEYIQLRDTRTRNERKKWVGEHYQVPKGVKKTSGVAANLLWDTLEYVLGVDTKGKPERVVLQHDAFRQRILSLPENVQEDAGIRAVLIFLNRFRADQSKTAPQTELQANPLWAEMLESNPNISFRLQSDLGLICERPIIQKAAIHQASSSEEDTPFAMCLVTGKISPIARLHTSIKGVWGAQSSGANIVSFNARAFESYGKTERQGENAPVSEAAMFAYTTAINHLLRQDSPQRIQIGDSSTVFWATQESELESVIADIFGEPPKDDPDRGSRATKALFSAVQNGKNPHNEDSLRMHVLGLAPNASRISVRFHHCLPLDELAEDIKNYFNDLSIARAPHESEYPSLFRLLLAVSAQSKADNIPPNLGGAIMDAIFAGKVRKAGKERKDALFPRTWLNLAVNRNRAEQTVTYYRAAILKACLNRQIRRDNDNLNADSSKETEFKTMLDLENKNVAYRLGRLFATLERAQEIANPGINATIRDRYYGAASSTPVAVFTTLIRLEKAHLKKMQTGQAKWIEGLMEEIFSAIPAEIPRQLPLADQGRFAVGYYHQRQDFFTKKVDAIAE